MAHHACLCSVGMFSWRRYKQETQHAAKTSSLRKHAFSNWLSREKGHVLSVEVCQRNWGCVSFWHQEAHLFRYARIALSVRGPLGNCYFSIHLFYFVFIFFMLLFFLISYSIPTHIKQLKWSDSGEDYESLVKTLHLTFVVYKLVYSKKKKNVCPNWGASCEPTCLKNNQIRYLLVSPSYLFYLIVKLFITVSYSNIDRMWK